MAPFVGLELFELLFQHLYVDFHNKLTHVLPFAKSPFKAKPFVRYPSQSNIFSGGGKSPREPTPAEGKAPVFKMEQYPPPTPMAQGDRDTIEIVNIDFTNEREHE